jgi:two-component sensor histidine kinase
MMAQEISVDDEIQKVDSLIEYHHYDVAEKLAYDLNKLLKEKYSGKKYLEQRLEVHFRVAIILDKQFKHLEAFPLFLDVLDLAEKNNLYKLACRANISIVFNQEKTKNYDNAYNYLHIALKMCQKYQFNELYSSVFIRYSLLYRFMNEKALPPAQSKYLTTKGLVGSLIDSSVHYAEKTVEYALKYNNDYDLNEAYTTLGILFSKNGKNRIEKSTAYFLKSIPYYKKTNYVDFAGAMYNNISDNYLKTGDAKTALAFSDSAFVFYEKSSDYYRYSLPINRSRVFDSLRNFDSAYYYYRKFHKDFIKYTNKKETVEIKNITEKYQNDKKEATIKNKNRQMLLIGILLGVIIIGLVLLYRKNRQIHKQNKTIGIQLNEITKTLEQKQVLLSELQHRVKNNLQHVISILEIQKESVDFNNIDELIRGNQNRVHSMALLHKKLNVADNVNDVDLQKYISELAELVKDSYDNHQKKITLNIKCSIENISIEKALPIGLIIVELVSNSMKHAFHKRSIGIINIEIYWDELIEKNKLYFTDNGVGFDFDKTNEKGLGMEIIKGLIDQLDGMANAKNDNGFELTIVFKN